MKNINCSICGIPLFSSQCETAPYPSKNASNDVPEKIIFCGHCGLGIAEPVPSDEVLARLYNESNYWGKVKPVVSPRKQPVFLALAHSRWSLIQSNLNKRKEKPHGFRILDVGAGFGYMGIVAANSLGTALDEYVAVELDPNVRAAIEKAWPELGNNSKLNTFAKLEEVGGKYDIIVLSHVLEHVKNPFSMINNVLSFLSNDGLLFIDVPNRDDLFKADVFPHLLFFSSRSLKSLMKQANLKIVDLDTWGNPREKSTLNRNASVTVKIREKLLGKITKFVPTGFSTFLLVKHFQINTRHERGTWIRVLAQMKGNSRSLNSVIY